MPIPTDTFWNIRRLNIAFAVSAVVMTLMCFWAIFQDYGKDWRVPQQHARVWDAAMTRDKIDRELPEEKQERVKQLDAEIEKRKQQIEQGNKDYQALNSEIARLESDKSNLEFRNNNLKAVVTVNEGKLQDAIAAGDAERIKSINADLAGPRKQVAANNEQLAEWARKITDDRDALKQKTAEIDRLTKEQKKLTGDVEMLRKRLNALQPPSLLAKLSAQIRAAPLMGFINPTEKVQQVVLPDVLTEMPPMKVAAIDRCMTCHVNIAKKDFTEEKVLAYLEEQLASGRRYRYATPLPDKPLPAGAPTADKPGATAMPEFWHHWGRKLLSSAALDKAKGPINAAAGAIGKVKVVYKGKEVPAGFKYDTVAATRPAVAEAADPKKAREQDEIILAAFDALFHADPKDTAIATARNLALQYPDRLRASLKQELPAEQYRLLEGRYRYALVSEVNVYRDRDGYSPLDASPVLLAHPDLRLYVEPDSKHPFESVGCTSCHDGSGQETDFVLAAHTARPIWVDERSGEPVLGVQLRPSAKREHQGAGEQKPDLSSMMAAVFPEDAVKPNTSSVQLHLVAEKTDEALDAPAEPVEAEDVSPVAYVDPVSGKTGRALPQMKRWMDKYESAAGRPFSLVYHEWDWPMRPPQYLQANCLRCHTDVHDIKEAAPVVAEGRLLFTHLGCVNCHQMDSVPKEENRKVGTDLRQVTAKLSPEFINSWIWAPKSFRPSTMMPHFFMLENNSSAEELRRTRQEVRAITEYLVQTATPKPPEEFALPQGVTGKKADGRTTFETIGCKACHTNLNDPSGKTRNNKPVTVGEDWIVNDLVKSGRLAREMEHKNNRTPTTSELTAEARRIYDEMSYNERQIYALENLGAITSGDVAPKYPDNSPKPVFMHHGPELSGVGTKLLAGRKPEEAKGWLFNWLKNPRHYSDYTVMPRLRLSDQQAMDLAEYLLDQKRTNDKSDDPWKAELTPVDQPKLNELVAFFLRSRFSIQTADAKAVEEYSPTKDKDGKPLPGEITKLAIEALTTTACPEEQAKARVEKMDLPHKQMLWLGKKLIGHYGCMSCHAINGTESISSPCANLSDWGQKGVDKLDFGYLDPHKVHSLPEAKPVPMVNGLSAQAVALDHEPEAALKDAVHPVDVAWPHVEHSRTSWITQKLLNTRVWDRGKALLDPDPARDDRGKPYDKLKMPTFYLKQSEVDAIVTFVISNRDRLVTEHMVNKTVTPEAKKIARGRAVAEKYNCVNCHQIEHNAPVVQQYYTPDVITTKAPPSLRGEGNKIQFSWLFNFLKNVEPLRPLPQIRMPSFPIEDDEASAVAAYFAAASNKESAELRKALDPVGKYIADEHKAALKPVQAPADPKTLAPAAKTEKINDLVRYAGALISDHDYDKALEPLTQAQAIAATYGPKDPKPAVVDNLADAIQAMKERRVPDGIPWPGDDWYAKPAFATTAADLSAWVLENKMPQLTAFSFDASKNSPTDLGKSYRMALFESGFVRELYDAPWPFVDSSRIEVVPGATTQKTIPSEITEARFKLGEKFFYEMQCLKCHILGDPNAKGVTPAPTAPNLVMAHRRLQRRWIRHWVQEPPIIQANTAMPPFFTGLPVFDLHGQSWPRAQKTERPAEQIEAEYGPTVEDQTNLLLDFLFAAGVRNYTAVQPAAPQTAGATPAAPAPAAPKPAVASNANPTPAGTGAPTGNSPPSGITREPGKPTPGRGEPPVQPGTKPATAAPAAPKPIQTAMATPPPKASAPAKPAGAGKPSITGKVVFEGTPPEMPVINMKSVQDCDKLHADPVPEETVVVNDNKTLKNVVISVTEGLPPGQAFPRVAGDAVVDQHGCMYQPHVLAMEVGQKLVIRNDDPFMHNVHSLAESNPGFNFAQPNVDPGSPAPQQPKTAEYIHIKCDVHPWMSGYIAVFDHPFFAVTGDDGSFTLHDLPPGEYTITAWHEKYGTQEQKNVKVEEGKPTTVNFTFKE